MVSIEYCEHERLRPCCRLCVVQRTAKLSDAARARIINVSRETEGIMAAAAFGFEVILERERMQSAGLL